VLSRELVNYKPDMAILYLAFNYLHMNRGSVNFPKDLRYRIFEAKRWLSSKSLFFLTLREKLNMLFHLEGNTLGDIYIPTNDPKTFAAAFLNSPEVFDAYKRDLEDFVKICRTHDIEPVFATEACVLKHGGAYMLLEEDMRAVYDKMYGIMESVAKEHGILFIDTAWYIREMPGNEKLFTDGLHLTSAGNEVLADVMYKSVFDKAQQKIASKHN
jgi:hypothetical protein